MVVRIFRVPVEIKAGFPRSEAITKNLLLTDGNFCFT